MAIVVIDNYDSFTYNLVHYLQEFEDEVIVMRNDQIQYNLLEAAIGIVLSPGPGLPEDSGEMMEVIAKYHLSKPIFGICLGLQALLEFFGGTLHNLEKVKHGISSNCAINSPNSSIIFNGITNPTEIGHYHSWVANSSDLPDVLEVTAMNEEGLIMAIQHRFLPIFAVQFHPESVLTPSGKTIISNWVEVIGR